MVIGYYGDSLIRRLRAAPSRLWARSGLALNAHRAFIHYRAGALRPLREGKRLPPTVLPIVRVVNCFLSSYTLNRNSVTSPSFIT